MPNTPIGNTIKKRRLWTEPEMVLTLDLYFKLPFGRLNYTTCEVIELAHLIGRTPSAVAFRLVNYAACDPYILNSGRHGMDGGKSTCIPYWEYYSVHREELFIKAAQFKAELQQQTLEQMLAIDVEDYTGKERETVIKQRVNQGAFRSMVLANYNERCAVTGIDIPKLLVASHIIPWAANEQERLNPENGICLSALYDRAFDQGLIGIKSDYRIILSSELESHSNDPYFEKHFASVADQKIILPEEHKPNKAFLDYHLQNVFLGI